MLLLDVMPAHLLLLLLLAWVGWTHWLAAARAAPILLLLPL
jgi:hypothetical protein